MDIPKNYDHKEVENEVYSRWEKSGFFNPDICVKKKKTLSSAPSFSIILPPPNVTGVLHLGHALGTTTEDILIRFHRMKGEKTLWLPGTDHAAIATQSKVEAIIQKEENKNRHDLGREEFLKRVNKFALESHDTIVSQIKKMGASIDWTREAYTLDEKRSAAVVTAFKTFYDLGLIYRGKRIVNWDPKGQTTVSDDEVNYEETEGFLYTFYYDKDFPIPIATTRPETKLGDTAVAVNPNDKRYKKYIGKEFEVNFVGQPLLIKVVGDDEVDPKFGTGAVGVTPAHSFVDWEIAKRHNLEIKEVINEYGKISIENSLFSGLKIKEAREKILEKLREENLLTKEEKIVQNIARAERTNGIIEPLPKLQWFIDVNKEFSFPHSSLSFVKKGENISLKKLMQLTVRKKAVTIVPERFEKTYFHWIDNLRDWCISRQIWFGHRVPVWYKDDDIFIGKDAPEKEGWMQDTDTLDTWFSSALWTFSTLGWPEETNDLKTYHPTNILETGYDILFFWVARMILMTTSLLGDIPFHAVYLHGIVRDEKGRKMSKSLGNSINPIEVAEKYGTDALRLSLIIGSAPGNDIKMSEEKIKAQKYFANKIWNASRFVLSVLPEDEDILEKIVSGEIELTKEDKKRKKELTTHIKKVTDDIENFCLYLSAEKIYHYFWDTFADVIIEDCKKRIVGGEEKEKLSAMQTLYSQLVEQLKIIHPFMPFITEKIWTLIPKSKEKEELLMMEKWPK
jgi:valyl-tRNA synthetase